MSKWLCPKCGCKVESDKSRCAFCSTPKPINESNMTDVEAVENDKFTQRLHAVVEKLTPLQKKKLWRYFEDNVL